MQHTKHWWYLEGLADGVMVSGIVAVAVILVFHFFRKRKA